MTRRRDATGSDGARDLGRNGTKWDRSPQNFVAKDLVMRCDETNAKHEGNEGWQPLHTVWKSKITQGLLISSRLQRQHEAISGSAFITAKDCLLGTITLGID